jgi:hypothetical protein
MITWQTAVSVVAGLAAIVFGYLAFSRNKKEDDQTEAKNGATMLVELGHLRSTTDRIENKQDALAGKMEQEHIETVTRLTAVEESAKQAHKRLDRLESKEA